MAKKLQLRRGTTTQHNSFTGAEGEVTVDTDKDSLVVHDGTTQGGHPIAKSSDLPNLNNYAALAGANFVGNVLIDNAQELRLGEADASGTNFTALKAQPQSGDITLTLPAVAPTANQVLKADSSTPTTLTWDDDTNTNTTYTISCVDGDNSDEEKIRLTDSGSGTDDVVLEAGTGLSVARSGDKITFTNTLLDTVNEWTKPQTGNVIAATHSSGATYDFDLDTSNNFKLTISAAVELGFSNLDASREGQTGTIWIDNGAITPTWGDEVAFEGGTTLDITQSVKSLLVYYVLPGGAEVLVIGILDVKDDA